MAVIHSSRRRHGWATGVVVGIPVTAIAVAASLFVIGAMAGARDTPAETRVTVLDPQPLTDPTILEAAAPAEARVTVLDPQPLTDPTILEAAVPPETERRARAATGVAATGESTVDLDPRLRAVLFEYELMRAGMLADFSVLHEPAPARAAVDDAGLQAVIERHEGWVEAHLLFPH